MLLFYKNIWKLNFQLLPFLCAGLSVHLQVLLMQVRSNSLEEIPGEAKLKVSLHTVLKWTCTASILNSLVKYLFLIPDTDSHISSRAKPQWVTTLSTCCITGKQRSENSTWNGYNCRCPHQVMSVIFYLNNKSCAPPPSRRSFTSRGLQNNRSFVWPEKSTGSIVLKTYLAPLFTLPVNPHFHWRLTGL